MGTFFCSCARATATHFSQFTLGRTFCSLQFTLLLINHEWDIYIHLLTFSELGIQWGHPACGKTEWWGAGVVICLGWGADLHTAQLMTLPLTVSCFSKIQISFTFLVLAHPSSPGQTAVKLVLFVVVVVIVVVIVVVVVVTAIRLSV